MTISENNEKNIKLVIIKTTFDEEEISTRIIEQAILDDPDDNKLRRKLDLHLIPTMTFLYLLSYLDRVNIGQAKIDGLMESINISSAQYNACLSVFFATYVIFEIPSNLILKRLRPSRWIPSIMIAWGIVMTLMGLANSYGSLLACRLLLGAAESGLFPGKKIFIRNEKIEKIVILYVFRCCLLSIQLV
jgi:sugar phosphate permease